ncbi:cathepsin L [Caerostris extrusa]|uniref:Cathepsin L n=1 Tax=Caerostris extrusa TaxID=172846 RepID=A0AAV4NDS3_CAEEX|nr:cathepsin L [Caerostris extrusa]
MNIGDISRILLRNPTLRLRSTKTSLVGGSRGFHRTPQPQGGHGTPFFQKGSQQVFRSDPRGVHGNAEWLQSRTGHCGQDQQSCGSCWAFSTTGSLEGQYKKKTGKLVSLSEQNLIDCVTVNNGCHGGTMDDAFEFIKNENGVDTEESYPYEAVQDSCSFKPQNVGATCTGHVDVPTGDEEALKQAVATVGPVSVAIDAHHESFHDYKTGIFDEPSCGNELSDLTHAVLVVGYGSEEGADYWLVKNSWGESFGHRGYIKMSRNKNNQCGIATMASYPLV